ncbi:hypothetical protein XPR_0638 [Xanthomonas arboricola pv. pruni MAFF 301420]|uniref:Uncharacterized protein n=11 Tax=Xanthomonas TaxID=338 RepID=W4SCU3_9XANT|nr:glutathione S-transferase [Xanthomonas arboricola pv. pruni str. MAFF 311562]GAE54003.1 hypothetical protein XPR_0638 [Xanthomonas arboricola pv. pruni MAFF 301420]GAE58225.1 hypothetical protein XPN_0131 [Xanthomonas arboricola pv. pruni MAFF 301427]
MRTLPAARGRLRLWPSRPHRRATGARCLAQTPGRTHRPSPGLALPLPFHPAQAVQCAGTPGSWRCPTDQSSNYEGVMSKGMDQKKSQKKEPTKTLKEKRAAKQEKKGK